MGLNVKPQAKPGDIVSVPESPIPDFVEYSDEHLWNAEYNRQAAFRHPVEYCIRFADTALLAYQRRSKKQNLERELRKLNSQ